MNTHVLFVVGRGLIAISFIVSAIGKASNWKDTVGLMQMHQMPWPTLGLTGALLIEIVGGGCLLVGTFLHPAVIALFAYLALATAFIIGSNIAILGGLVLVLALKGF